MSYHKKRLEWARREIERDKEKIAQVREWLVDKEIPEELLKIFDEYAVAKMRSWA